MLRFLTLAVTLTAPPLNQAEEPILQALLLPTLATAARQAGVADGLVREVLDALRRSGLSAQEAALVVDEEVEAVNAGAPKDNFGGFVQRQLAAGLRGRALAEAIRAEHRARGVGRSQRPRPAGPDTGRSRGGRP